MLKIVIFIILVINMFCTTFLSDDDTKKSMRDSRFSIDPAINEECGRCRYNNDCVRIPAYDFTPDKCFKCILVHGDKRTLKGQIIGVRKDGNVLGISSYLMNKIFTNPGSAQNAHVQWEYVDC